ncbi:CRISPR-associated helicase Cas3, protein [Rhodovastum atsumiense]|uniref:CRISPR-associated helicase Cas3' n=1 Tax=Rhodovastum atsumiense TaxID=504468 RepID=UPI002024F3FC|nr:CRISPR-associated helicase Cas3' [Rhodovastum atsumiense]CAH2603749.1 CRISPR-associated helicase Cas3, protein [Rhodovastum atsumiense]
MVLLEHPADAVAKTLGSAPEIMLLSLNAHAADVAAVTEALLSLPTISMRLGHLAGFGGPISPSLIARLCVLVALHDAGKVNVGFRNRIRSLPGPTAGHVRPIMDLLFHPLSRGSEQQRRGIRTALITALRLNDVVNWFPDPDQALCAVLAHHGALPATGEADLTLWEPLGTYDPITAARRLGDALPLWFPHAFGPDSPTILPPRFLHAFAGIVTWADWLGSDSTVFGPAGDPWCEDGGTSRLDWARAQARALLERRFIMPAPRQKAAQAPDLASFARLLPGFTPHWAQQQILSAPLPEPGEVRVLEAETGSGKTEAALIHFLRLLAARAVDGLFFALPTRASAVAMQQRVTKKLRDWLGAAAPPVGLAVPGYLRVDDRDGQAQVDWSVLWPDDPADTRHDRGWAVETPKRYLTGAVMVGTIDQLLLGGMRVRHAPLRSGPMLRQLLVIDEVHASDAYMSTLLLNVLDQHRAAGGHTFLMSATLGAAARHRLLHNTLRDPPTLATAREVPYPALLGSQGLICGAPPPDEAAGKAVTVMLDADASPGHAAALAADAASRGARVLVIRNLVRLAQATQSALETLVPSDCLFSPNGRPAPHHARFAVEDRFLLDAELEARFGRDAQSGGIIAVSTQTAEQSLDIDADLLITDLCPCDVLLQRFGRLHRHRRPDRPAGFATPCAIVLAPPIEAIAPSPNGTASHAPLGFGKVYPDLSILAATRLALVANPIWRIPHMNRDLVERTTHPEALKTLALQLGPAWVRHVNEINTGAQIAQITHAKAAWLAWKKALAPLPELDAALATRLGLGRRVARFETPQPGPFGTTIQTLPVPAWMVEGIAPAADPAPEAIRPEPDKLHFRFAGREFVYDRLGLRLAEAA